jgi:hypothetical protein
MALPNGIEAYPLKPEFVNRHENFTQTINPAACFKLRIPMGLPDDEAYRQTTRNLQWLIRYGIDNGVRLRALGSNWSFTTVGVTNGGVVDISALQQSFVVYPAVVAPAYLQSGRTADNLFFTECGTHIIGLEQELERLRPAKSLRASGATNGQTIAGACATGTHGSAFGVGAVHDTVVGLHLVCGPDRHVWLERASYPVAAEAFTDWLGVTEVLRDDELFNAVLVGFGSFGFIHGMMLEIEDLFLLEEFSSRRVPYAAGLQQAMTRLDLSGLSAALQLPPATPERYPWHFQLIVNPHQFDPAEPEHGAYVRVFYHAPYRLSYPPRPAPKPGFTYGDDTMGLIQTVLDRLGPAAPLLVPKMVNLLYPQALDDHHGTMGTMRETFTNTNIRGEAASAAIGIAAADSPRVLEEIIALNAETAFPGLLGLRYVKGTAATLGFTRFPLTCVLEMDGIESNLTRRFFQRTWDRLEELHIPYTLHWGKINFNLTPQRVRRMYGDAAVDSWLGARHRLLDAPTRAVFTNPFMEQCGLDGAPAALPV